MNKELIHALHLNYLMALDLHYFLVMIKSFYINKQYHIYIYLLLLERGLLGFLGILGPPRILRRNLLTESRTPERQLCSDKVSRDHGLTSNMSIAAIARARPTCNITFYYTQKCPKFATCFTYTITTQQKENLYNTIVCDLELLLFI
jgi:hypothetical protein